MKDLTAILPLSDGLIRYNDRSPFPSPNLNYPTTSEQVWFVTEVFVFTAALDSPIFTPSLMFDMAENPEQTKRDALFILDALKHVKSKVIVRPSSPPKNRA